MNQGDTHAVRSHSLDPDAILRQAIAVASDQSSLARVLDTSPSTVSRWMSSDPRQRSRPEVGFVLRLAKVTGNPPAATLRAFGYDPEVLGLKDEPEDGSEPRSARASAIASQMETLPAPVQDWVLIDLLPRLRTMKPPPTWEEGSVEQTQVFDENKGNYAYQAAQSRVFASRTSVLDVMLGVA